MFNADQRDRGKPVRSLLSLAEDDSGGPASRQAPPLVALAPRGPSPAERHRVARSRREAARSPLVDALAAPPPRAPSTTDGEPAVPRTAPAKAAAAERHGAAEPPPTSMAAPAAPSPAGTLAAGDEWRPLIDPVRIWQGITRSRWIILTATISGAALGIAVALSTPKKYESVAELLVDPRDLKISDRNVTEGGLPNDATLAIVENQVRVLTSGNVLSRVVDTLNLSADPEFNGQEESFGLGSVIAGLRAVFSSGDKGEGDRRRALAIQALAKSLDVERGGKTFVVSIAATTRSPDKSALIANTLTQTFLQSYGDIQSDTAGRASDELTARLAELQKGVEEAERKVEAYKSERDLVDAQGRLISDDEMVKLNEQLSVARARTIELNARGASARELDVDAIVGGNLPEQINSPTMAELRTQYATSKQEVERLAVRLGPRHPERLAAEAQLAGARDSLAAELRRISASIQVELRRAVQLEQDLASRLAQLKSRQGKVSEDLVTVRELEREAAAKRAVYESFLLRARETNEQRGINTANMSVISVAQPPLESLGPSRSVIVAASTLLGLLAGVGIGGARGAVDSLRFAGGGMPTGPVRPRAPVRTRAGTDDEIDRIMRAAAGTWTSSAPPDNAAPASPPALAPASAAAAEPTPPRAARTPTTGAVATAASAPVDPAPAQPDPSPARGTKDPAMNPNQAYPYPPAPNGYPQQPMAPAATPQPWYDPQAASAAHVAHQQALYQAWMASRPPQPVYPAQPQMPHWAGWPQHPAYAPPSYPPQPLPMAMQPPQPWPLQPQYAPPQGWSQGAEAPPAAAVQSAPRGRERAEASAIEEIRDSLREFREAVRDLADSRSRGRA
jgi:uncharacterized protein involved in exopolysaccharide biosynthesis